MRRYVFKLISLLLTVIMMLSITGCNDILVPVSPRYGIVYETRSFSSTKRTFGYAFYNTEISMTIRFLNEHPNVKVEIMESDYYEIVGESEFNTNDYPFDEKNNRLDIDFKVKITEKSDGVQAVIFRITCLCGDEDCGRFQYVSDGHYYVDKNNFGFNATGIGIFLANNHSNVEGYNKNNLKQLGK